MPTIRIDTSFVESEQKEGYPPFIRLPEGLVMIEIQGTINHPTSFLGDEEIDNSDDERQPRFLKNNGVAVRLGQLTYDSNDPTNKNIELSIGKNQKLIGNVTKLDKPLAILKFPEITNPTDSRNPQYLGSSIVQVVDIIRYKLLFKKRPVPQVYQ